VELETGEIHNVSMRREMISLAFKAALTHSSAVNNRHPAVNAILSIWQCLEKIQSLHSKLCKLEEL